MKQYKRSTRLGGQILKDISIFFQENLSASAPDFVTFTRVELTDDLKYATVYYSSLGSDEQREAVRGFLDREKKKIRHGIGKGLHIRSIPEIKFKFDPSIEEGIRIEQLLNEIKTDEE